MTDQAGAELIGRYAEANATDDFRTLDALRHPDWQEAWPQSGEIVTSSANYRAARTQRPWGAPPWPAPPWRLVLKSLPHRAMTWIDASLPAGTFNVANRGASAQSRGQARKTRWLTGPKSRAAEVVALLLNPQQEVAIFVI